MPYSEDLRLRVLGAIDAGMSKLAQLAQAWEQETGVKLTLMPFSHALRRIGAQGKGWTRKKRVGATVSAARKTDKAFSRS